MDDDRELPRLLRVIAGTAEFALGIASANVIRRAAQQIESLSEVDSDAKLLAAAHAMRGSKTETIHDRNGVRAWHGMRARHNGEDDQADRVYLGTIVEAGVTEDERMLYFVYDEPPANLDEQIAVPLFVVNRFEIIDP